MDKREAMLNDISRKEKDLNLEFEHFTQDL